MKQFKLIGAFVDVFTVSFKETLEELIIFYKKILLLPFKKHKK